MKWDSAGLGRYQNRCHIEGLSRYSSSNLPLRMWNVDFLPTPCPETKQISSILSEKVSQYLVAKQDRSDTEIHRTLLMKCQLRWTGHVIRMQDTRLSQNLFFGEPWI